MSDIKLPPFIFVGEKTLKLKSFFGGVLEALLPKAQFRFGHCMKTCKVKI